jgi:4a-hydroxytetrahydrobiopterin dehydratase
MTDLATQSCVSFSPSSKEAPKSPSNNELAEYLQQLVGWQVVPGTDANNALQKLEKTFSFDNYQQSMDFTNRVAELAEAEDHHPALLTEWGKVRVTWWTHAIGGLHLNDFICAAKTDLLNQ